MFAADANALELLHQQLVEVDGQLCMPGHETNLGELLLTAAEKKGEGVCLEVDTACYTFAQMARMATAIRRVLRKALQSLELPTEPGSPEAHRRRADEHVVTIVLDRGVKSIAAVHAVMLERCAYSAFDVAEPIEKLRTWVEVARPPVMISSSGVLKRLGLTDIAASLGEFPRVVLDVDLALRKAEEATVPTKARHSPDDLDRLAYLIFTSGSTGKPKAVMIRHKSALNVARIWGNYVGLSSQDRFAQVASMSWDVHIIEVYGTMAAMATSVTCPDLVKKSGPDMVSWLKERQISGMSVVPSHLRTMSAAGEVSTRALPHLKILDVGGEALGADVVDAWAPGRRLVNSYGPSEISVVCTGAYVTPGEPITIGGPLPTYSCYILDPETLEEKAQGEQGVLFVGGVGLARGYLEEEEKTRSKFLEHPRLGRVYDTGDLASVDKLGRINYHGRVDWQVKVRGVRIELEALEQAIAELAGVQHCEARVSEDNQRLVLLVSGSSSEAELKQKALSLGRGYMLSQVKMVDSGDWKFNASGKLLRNAVPLEEVVREVKQDGWEAFDKSECSELELEIAQCLAPQVTEAWSRKDHFMEDLGVDSGGFGRLITQMRARPRLHKVDLQMLFEHPTVQALAQHLSEESADSDDEVTADSAGETFVDVFLASVAMNPHSLCRESQCEALSYLQMRRLACAYQRLLRRAKPRRPAPVAILLQGYQQMAAMIAACMEGFAFCLLDNTEDSAEQLQQLEPCAIMAEAQTLAELAWKAKTSAALVDVSGASALLTQPPLANLGAKAEDAACVALAPGTQPLVLSHSQLAALVEVWRPHLMPSKRVRLSAGLGTCARTVAAVATMSCGATLVEDRPQLVISEVSGRTPKAQTLVVAGQTWFTAVPEAPARLNSATWSQNSRLSGLLASASRLSLATELGPYMLGRGKNKSYGPHSWPKLCAMVQGLAILAQPVMIAARLLLAERILLPMIFVAPMWLIAIVLLALLTFEQFLRVFILVATKWILIGRYREGDHDIYSLYYLRHWLVEHVAKGTLVGQAAHQGSSISFLFLRNLGLPEGSFCGVGTWLPNRPTEPNMSYFGNPAMKFRRLGNQSAGTRQGPERASCLARMWHHFSTSVMDVFLYRGVQGMVTGLALLSSRRFCPVITQVWEPFALLLIYMAYALGSWYLFSVVLGNLLFNNSAPHSNAYYSTTVTRWFTALTAQQRVFKLPFQTAGSRWQAPILRLLGARVGKRFFCMNEMVLVDAPFTEVGDDVTVDYDGQVRCHSFEDFRLKFTTFKIGHGVTIMTGASVAMCDAGDGATLRPGSLTWKGSNLEPGGVYEGAPAALDLERGPTLLRKAPMEGK
ncbi:unnamed protein product [Effrenium voratum]|nr:unnamed protein product [Effrenium voratum]